MDNKIEEQEGKFHTDGYLVLVDSTPRCVPALCYAVEQSMETGGIVLMAYVLEPVWDGHWVTVEQAMKNEEICKAGERLVSLASDMWGRFGIEVRYKILEESNPCAIVSLLQELGKCCSLVLRVPENSKECLRILDCYKEAEDKNVWFPIVLIPGMGIRAFDCVGSKYSDSDN